MAQDGLWKAVVSLGSVTDLPEDVSQNVLHGVCDFGVGVSSTVKNLIIDFYNTVAAGATTYIAEKMSTSISRSANKCRIDVYLTDDFTGATPFGSPVDGANFTLAVSDNATPLPEEVATVISYHADLNVPVSAPNPSPPPATIRPQARRRGRMYVGPLGVFAGTDVGNFFRPATIWREDLGDAFKAMAAAIDAIDTDHHLGVWSAADAACPKVEGGYVDDAWDTQRRRGVEATLRTTFTV